MKLVRTWHGHNDVISPFFSDSNAQQQADSKSEMRDACTSLSYSIR
jgi:hypothetical protein